MTLDDLIRRLEGALRGSLPGGRAHLRMARRPRVGFVSRKVPAGVRRGAALLLFFPRDDEAHFVLTRRTDHVAHHRGQVSLPGGGMEAGETVEAAALREAHEEVGIDPTAPRVLGVLSPLHVPVSGYLVHPVVAACDRRPTFRRAEREVARVVEVPVSQLLDPSHLRLETWPIRGISGRVPYFDLAGEKVWGATAMILAECLELLGHRPEPWTRRGRGQSGKTLNTESCS